ncbi:MAG: amino acid racemase [Pseudomonadota bacterium]
MSIAPLQADRTALKTVGVLGGMGPAAGIAFAQALLEETARQTRVTCDQDQVPFLLWSIPQVPDRVGPIFDNSLPSPAPMMVHGAKTLAHAGADVIAIACNTAHHWHGEIARAVDVPVLDIAAIVAGALGPVPRGPNRVGILATRATQAAGLFDRPLVAQGWEPVYLSETDRGRVLEPAIHTVKTGRPRDAAAVVVDAIDQLRARAGFTLPIVLACTELPLALAHVPEQNQPPHLIDAGALLARAAVAHALGR